MTTTTAEFVPANPHYVPGTPAISAAGAYIKERYPKSYKVEAVSREGVDVFFPGTNMTSCACPECGAAVDEAAWQSMLASDYVDMKGFYLLAYPISCCGALVTPRELRFDWPVAFGKFALRITDPEFDTNDQAASLRVAKELEPILGCELIPVVGRW
jgi:hypothetical protein